MDKKDEEQHSMSKPKPLEDPLTEIKKDPVWKTWLKQKDHLSDEKREHQRKREQKLNENIHGDFSGDPDKMTPTPEQIERKRIRDEKEAKEEAKKKERHSRGARTAARNRRLKKTRKKIARLGDLSQYKLPKSKPSKYKDPQTMSKFPKKLGKPVRKIESAEIDSGERVQHGQFKQHTGGSVAGVETKQPKMPTRADDLKPESLGDKVQHKKPNQALEGRAKPLTERDPVKTDYGSSPTEDLEKLPQATRGHPDKKRAERGERVSTGWREQRIGAKRIKTPYGKQQGGDADIEFFSGKQKGIFDRFRKRRSTHAQPEDLKRDDKPQSSLNPKRRPSTSIQAPDKTIGTTKPQKQTKIETDRYMATVPKESQTPPYKFPKSHEAKPKVSQMGRIQANQGKKEPPIKQANPLQTLTERKQPERTTAIGTQEPDKPTKERKVPHAKEAAILLKTLMVKMYIINKKRVDSKEPTGNIDPQNKKRTVYDTISGGFATAKVPRKVGTTTEGMKRAVGEDKDQADPPNKTTTHRGGEIRGTTEGVDPKLQPKIPRKSKPKPKPKPIKGAPIKKGKKVPKKEPKLPQTKIDEPKHWWDHSKVGRQGDIDQKTGRYWWEVVLEEEKKKRKDAEKGRTARNRRRREDKEEIIEAHIAAQVNKDYFVEEIRANIIFENKIAPLLGMIAGKVGQQVMGAGKKMAQGIKEGARWLVTPQEEEEE